MTTILVQMADARWTEQALHLACAVTRSTHAGVTLLRLIPVQHYSWLGTPFGYPGLSSEESARIWKYKGVAEKYGAELTLEQMQSISLVGALCDAADLLDAQAVFASIPDSIIPFWRKYLVWELRRLLAQHQRTLYTFDHPSQSMILATQFGVLQQRA